MGRQRLPDEVSKKGLAKRQKAIRKTIIQSLEYLTKVAATTQFVSENKGFPPPSLTQFKKVFEVVMEVVEEKVNDTDDAWALEANEECLMCCKKGDACKCDYFLDYQAQQQARRDAARRI